MTETSVRHVVKWDVNVAYALAVLLVLYIAVETDVLPKLAAAARK